MIGTPRIRRPSFISGNGLGFRPVTVVDASFILKLRLDPEKNRHLSPVQADLSAQEDWIRAYLEDETQAYFIICDRTSMPIGTVRIYDPQQQSFSWGSWILSNGVPKFAAIESTLIVYAFATRQLGFISSHFEVRKENHSVCSFHERMGAHIVKENAVEYFYTIGAGEIAAALSKYEKFLPNGISVAW